MENKSALDTDLTTYHHCQQQLVAIALSILLEKSNNNWFMTLLKNLLEITRCEFGFIGLINNHNRDKLQLCALHDLNWPHEKVLFIENTLSETVMIEEYHKLLDNSLKEEQFKLLNLVNEPSIDNFKAIPIIHENKKVAFIGLGSREIKLNDTSIKLLDKCNDLILLIIKLIMHINFNLDKNHSVNHTPQELSIDSSRLIKDLKLALSNNQLHLAYQPQVHMTTKIITGFEALLRWEHPVYGNISPAVFIPLAEQADLAEQINLYVLKKSINDFNQLFKKEEYPLKLSINVSPHVKDLSSHCQALNEIIKKKSTLYKSIKLELEITENDISNNGEDMENLSCLLRSMKKSLVSIAVDNFGLKKTSIERLLNYNFNVLKINHQFTHALGSKDSLEAKNIIAVILDIAKRLNFDVIAEGVETQQQADILLSLGCAKAQGFYYYFPMPIEDVHKLLQAQKL